MPSKNYDTKKYRKCFNISNIAILLGNSLVILTTFALIYLIPKYDSDSEKVYNEIQSLENNISDDKTMIVNYEAQENATANEMTILRLMEALKLQGKDEYKYIVKEYFTLNIASIQTIASITGFVYVPTHVNFTQEFDQIRIQLNRERFFYENKAHLIINLLNSERENREEQENAIKSERMIIIFWSGVCQVIGLLLLAFVSRERSRNE